MVKFLQIIFMLTLFSACSPLIKWQTEYPDNYAEEYIENLIENKTGYDLDFTPITGEERQNTIKKDN